ncbi:MAG TPA: glycoside hydrolase family 15 protein [Candidatus Bathyarchaeia archaeon]|nr:glycoside hydrolase family 15 protein [Candidatus Bathyarchaeia archaeon]
MKLSPVTQKPYLNDAVIGNSSMLAALGFHGEIYRLWWPHQDMAQHIEKMQAGIFVEGHSKETLWLNELEAWDYAQAYLPKSNILRTTAIAKQLPLTVETIDFVVPDEDLLVRHYRVANTGQQPLRLRFFYYASMNISENKLYNTVAYEPTVDGLLYFRHHYAFALAGANDCTEYTTAAALQQASSGHLPGNGIAMVPDGALGWLLEIQPGATADVPVYLTAADTIDAAVGKMKAAKTQSPDSWQQKTLTYWEQYLATLPELPATDERIRSVYERSLLVFPLMADKATGSVIAAPEFDEAFTRCGGYAYCWGRDAAYITTAFDRAGLTDLSRHFYRWTLLAQSADGSWQQRHYHDGRLAPSWGLQIDEGGSILWGMYQHYLATQDLSFLEEMWPAVEKGTAFLLAFLDAETGLPLPSRDLWEEREAEHTYSAAAVYGGIRAAAEIAKRLEKEAQARQWEDAADLLQEAILQQTYNPETGLFYRGVKLSVDQAAYQHAKASGKAVAQTTDPKGYVTHLQIHDEVMDISLIGLSVPFAVLDANDPRIAATADAIERTCTSPLVGGIRRYEDDHYIGGNPWILTTLWLAQFRISQGRYDEAKKHLDWAVSHATSLDLLPEQIDQNTGEAAWVIPLTWSHAMFVLTVHMLHEAGQL